MNAIDRPSMEAVRVRWATLLLSSALLCIGCDGNKGLQQEDAFRLDGGGNPDVWQAPDVGPSPTCWACHGSEGNPAPPNSIRGETATTSRAVGAHRIHLRPADWHAAIRCEDCHRVPRRIDDPGHLDPAPAELTFSAKAKTGALTPLWNGSTCSQVYCHGATLGGGTLTEPSWTKVDASQARCGSCHSLPPTSEKHPKIAACHLCHGKVVDEVMRFVGPELHINGVVDFSGNGVCSGCHGSADNAAPPKDTHGNGERSLRGVGAHQAHVKDTSLHKAYGCEVCHIVPQSIDAPGHMDTPPAEVVFGALAKGASYVTRSGTPLALPVSYDDQALTCSKSYCHDFDGAQTPTPTWTKTDALGCGDCHSLPPATLRQGGTHPAATPAQCTFCHPGVGSDGQSFDDPTRHADGKVDFNGTACNSCHGSANNAAPPQDTRGNTSPTVAGVGAHQAHVTDGPLHTAYGCEQCHIVPQSVGDPGHLDAAPAEIVFGPIATGQTIALSPLLTPSYNADGQHRCADAYCHSFDGATVPTPAWTRNQSIPCGGCHGMPPVKLRGGGLHLNNAPKDGKCTASCHPANYLPMDRDKCTVMSRCHDCHANVGKDGRVTDPSSHADGKITGTMDQHCTCCHMQYGAPGPECNP